MTKNVVIIILLFTNQCLHAQDTLLGYDKSTHNVFLASKIMTMDDLFKTMRPHPQSFELIESARDCKFYATVFYSVGAAPVGFTLGYFLFTNEVKWPILATGMGLIAIGIPLHVRYLKQTQRAVDSFNGRNSMGTTGTHPLELSLNYTQNGIGVKLQF